MRRVALVYPASVPWIARCLDGIRRYAHEHGGWHLLSSPPTLSGAEESALTLQTMRDWKGDAIIAVTNDEDELSAVRQMGIPVVNLAGGLPQSSGIPRVMVNHYRAGQLAADHLLGLGLRHLAYFGWKGLWYSEQRRLGFVERAASAGVTCDVLLRATGEDTRKTWGQRIVDVTGWLSSLTTPTGILAVHDYRAQFLMEACHEIQLLIPGDIALMGMDDDETICEHSVPTLTSISRNSERVGWEAAALLDRMMNGEPVPSADILIDPDRVIGRQSTDRLYCSDPTLQRAIDYMRSRIGTQFNIEHLAEHVGVSKRTLETRFRASLETSPHEFLTRLRVQHARILLQRPEKPNMRQTASECGFGSESSFYQVFRRLTGESPATYLKRAKSKGGAA